MAKAGRLYGIGVGPGDPGLLTLKAVKAIREAGVIFVPKGDTGRKSQALEIITPFLGDGQEVRGVTLPMTRKAGVLKEAWEQVAGEVLEVLGAGKDAVFVTLGDSTLYSTWYYLAEVLRELQPGLAVATLPGIASFSSGAALLNRALAVGQESLAVVPATRGRDFLRQVLTCFDCVVLLKVAPVLEEVLALLKELGRLEDAAYVSRCGMPGQFLKENLALPGELPGDYFSLILVRGRDGR